MCPTTTTTRLAGIFSMKTTRVTNLGQIPVWLLPNRIGLLRAPSDQSLCTDGMPLYATRWTDKVKGGGPRISSFYQLFMRLFSKWIDRLIYLNWFSLIRKFSPLFLFLCSCRLDQLRVCQPDWKVRKLVIPCWTIPEHSNRVLLAVTRFIPSKYTLVYR